VVDLSSPSDKGKPIPVTSRDFEFTQRLFGELDHSLLGPFGDGKIIILNDLPMPKTWLLLLQSTLPQLPSLMLLRGLRIIVMMRGSIKRPTVRTVAEMTPMSLRLPRQQGAESGMLQGLLQ
jgi:hypothetical protein